MRKATNLEPLDEFRLVLYRARPERGPLDAQTLEKDRPQVRVLDLRTCIPRPQGLVTQDDFYQITIR